MKIADGLALVKDCLSITTTDQDKQIERALKSVLGIVSDLMGCNPCYYNEDGSVNTKTELFKSCEFCRNILLSCPVEKILSIGSEDYSTKVKGTDYFIVGSKQNELQQCACSCSCSCVPVAIKYEGGYKERPVDLIDLVIMQTKAEMAKCEGRTVKKLILGNKTVEYCDCDIDTMSASLQGIAKKYKKSTSITYCMH